MANIEASTGQIFLHKHKEDVKKAGDTMTGALNISLATGNSLIVDTTTLVVDATNHRVGIGTASPGTLLQLRGTAAYGRLGQAFEVNQSANNGGMALNTWSTTGDHGSLFDFNRSKSATIGTQTLVASGDRLGTIIARGSDGTNFQDSAGIEFRVDGTPGTNDMPGRISFLTTLNGTIAILERMRIDNAGNVGIGNSAPLQILDIGTAGTGTATMGIQLNTDASNVGPRFLRYSRSASTRFDFGYDGILDTFFVSNGAQIKWGADRDGHFHIKSDDNSGHAVPVSTITLKVESANTATSPLVLQGTGGELARMLNSGNFGIGTAGPINKLDVSGGVAIGFGSTPTTAPTNGLIVQGNVGLGSGASTTDFVKIGGSYTGGAGTNTGLNVNLDMTPPSGQAAVLTRISGTITEASSGTATLFSGLYINALPITDAGAATTNAASFVVAGAPTGITPASGNPAYAMWVSGGVSRFDGNVGIGVSSPTAVLMLKAGTATASTAPLKFTSGTSLTTAEAGAVEFTTDDLFFTITTGAARKAFILDDGARLTSGRVPFATTNGRLTDDADMTFATDTLTVTKIGTTQMTGTTTHTGSMIVKSVTDAGPMTATNGTVAEIVFNTSDSKFYGCTVTGTPATWAALN